MSVLELIVRIVDSLAWPITTLVVIAILRRPIVALIPALQRLKFKELELEFREKLSAEEPKLVPALNTRPVEQEKGTPKTLKNAAHYEDIARISQRAAILEVWIEVEAAASEAYIKLAKPGEKIFVSTAEALDVLVNRGIIDDSNRKRARLLRELRNRAAHETENPNLSGDIVSSYIESCLYLAEKIRRNAALLED